MADPIVADTPSLGTKALDLAESGAKVVGNAVKAVAKSVVDDGVNLVGKDVALGTRVEAGLNLAADVSSFVVGPEDAAAERAAVFAVKEGVAHAPQIAEAAEVAVKAGIEKAPEIEKAAVSAFEKTKTLLEHAGHKFEDVIPHKGVLETKNAVYKVLEEGVTDLEKVYNAVGKAGMDALEKNKNFVVHAEKAEDAVINEIKSLRHESIFEAKGLKTAISATEMKLGKAIETVEHSTAIEHAEHLLSKGKEAIKSVSEPVEGVKKIIEGVKQGAEFVKDHYKTVAAIGGIATLVENNAHRAEEIIKTGAHQIAQAASEAEHHVVEGAKAVAHVAVEAEHRGAVAAKEVEHRVTEGAKSVVHAASRVENSVSHVATEAEHHVAAAAKSVVDDVKSWTPDMSFEKFGALINQVRGGSPSVSPEVTHSHDLTRSNSRKPDLGHGH